ncbi:response regulator transcription factor [Alkaliphilus peptidifermentans]|uniref:Stage 0 sporulation protein A homolog n=1 Tax=Alkaliphilus peptidifermentans DSM 18978 TaxID=1120976 RepID=A0A1G5KPL8_9FIRM|nr:response regulator transcription factor [Alkaliphilus peptidifermentans]SCZ02060.1 DNA-binding response regulator, OmpR family, contains REC and winged-helix (wHTH) domain [Alkaliphilus peptidifermentans DSM 18978]
MGEDKKKVLVVEDEASIRKFLSINLNRSGFEVLESECGEEALQMIEKYYPSVAILDVMLPGIDGFEVCQKIRKLMPEAVIIMLTAKGQDMDKIMGLELGADDYMVKPFNPLELIARIHANLRKVGKSRENNHNIYKYKELKLDLKGQRFYKGRIEIELTPTEFAIMKVLMGNPEKAFSRDEILNLVWGEKYFGDMKTVDVHVRRIREKIERNPSIPQWIETVWGYGYRLRGAEKNGEY